MSRERNMNGTLDGWVEPAVAAAKPSYDDHGGAPYGVLTDMQPLGEAPSAQVRKRVKGEGGRKSMLGRSAAGVGVEAQDTPETTPGPSAHAAAPSPVKLEPETVPHIVVDDENDDDYAPAAKKAKKKESAPRPRPVKQTSDTRPATAATATGRVKKQKINTNRVYKPAKLKSVVEEAKRRAHEVNRPELADAVNEIYLNSLTNNRLTCILENILLQKASKEETSEFHDYVRAAKRKLREAKAKTEAAELESQLGRNLPEQKPKLEANDAKSLPLRSPVKTEPAAAPKAMPTAIPSTERADPPKAKLSLKVRPKAKSSQAERPTSSKSARAAAQSKRHTDEVDAMSDVSELTELSEGDDMQDDTPEPGQNGSSRTMNGVRLKDHAAERGSLGVTSRNLKRSSADADLEDDEDDRELAAKKQKFSGNVRREYRYEESNLRDRADAPLHTMRGPAARNGAVMSPRITLQPNGSRTASAGPSRAVSTDPESPLSSPALSSRGGTPAHVWRGPPRPTGKRAKTKTSPMKKGEAAAGGMPIPHGGAGRASPIRDDDNGELSDNNDYCSACGQSGFLLCCDGCDKSFHFQCLDPPLTQDAAELNEPWYCFHCVAKRPVTTEQPEQSSNRLFGGLLNSLNKKNPTTFSLPPGTQDFFEGVQAGKHGEFTEVTKAKTRHRSGLEDKPDDLRLKDSKGKVVLCHLCSKSSGGTRPVITCDTCSAHWHIDCLDPPLANVPNRDANGLKTGEYLCPLHVEHDLRRIDTVALGKRQRAFPPRVINVRRPKRVKLMESGLSRGNVNSGIIEIESEDDESDYGDEFYRPNDGSNDSGADGPSSLVKLPTAGIVLDFIAKVKKNRESVAPASALPPTPPSPPAVTRASFDNHTTREQQIALQLATLSGEHSDLGLGSDRVENLVFALIRGAPEEVLNPTPANPNPTRDELLRLQKLIARALEKTPA